jgi:hypothetical protein
LLFCRTREEIQAIHLLSSGRGPLTTIESNSNVTLGSITPLSTDNHNNNDDSSSSSQKRMALSHEKQMMKRLLQAVAKDKPRDTHRHFGDDDVHETSSYLGDDSSTGSTNENLMDDVDSDRKYIKRFLRDLKSERESLKEEWRREFEEEQRRNKESLRDSLREGIFSICNWGPLFTILSYLEVFLSNMPITIGAVGLSWVTQGTIWFKFMEENSDSCTPAFFYSKQCSYPEFPGCFECDTTNPTYIAVVSFHYFCHCVALTCCILFIAKCILAWKVVADELSNPTTATPIGVVCITLICVAAGRFGPIGECAVLLTSAFHVLISFWFIYMAVFVFRLQPDPSWFPCTVGIAYAAVKSWIYYTIPGFMIMVLCVIYFFTTFFIA